MELGIDATEVDEGLSAEPADERVEVHAVLDELLRRLHLYTYAANTLTTEGDQIRELSRALEHQEVVMHSLVDCTAPVHAVAAPMTASGITPLRTGGTHSQGLINTPAPTWSPHMGHGEAGHRTTVAPVYSASLLTPQQRAALIQVGQASNTFVHRLRDHTETAAQTLRTAAAALGAEGVAEKDDNSRSGNRALPRHPSVVAMACRQKLQVAATMTDLHRRTATLTRATERVTELLTASSGSSATAPLTPKTHPSVPFVVSSPSRNAAGGAESSGLSLDGATPSSIDSTALSSLLSDLRRQFTEAERHALLPFSELLCCMEDGGSAVSTTQPGAATPGRFTFMGGAMERASYAAPLTPLREPPHHATSFSPSSGLHNQQGQQQQHQELAVAREDSSYF